MQPWASSCTCKQAVAGHVWQWSVPQLLKWLHHLCACACVRMQAEDPTLQAIALSLMPLDEMQEAAHIAHQLNTEPGVQGPVLAGASGNLASC